MKMIKVGVTGGIGSGKSIICRYFKLIGIPVFEADLEAKQIINNSAIVRSQMIIHFGKDIYLPNQVINRKKLADTIFKSPSSLKKVNSIIHPQVKKKFNEWTEEQKTDYVVHEAAILFESGFYKMMDFMILVTAPVELRIKRVIERDNVSKENVIARMKQQWEDPEKIKLSNLVLTNDNTELIIPQLIEFDKTLRRHG